MKTLAIAATPTLLFLLMASSCATKAPPVAPVTDVQADVDPVRPAPGPLPIDPSIDKGQLANGLTYYIRANLAPTKRAFLRLVVRAGSVQEDDDQRGLAHFVEHMAFKGTRLFRKNEIASTLEKAGARFGRHTNAYTTFDETVYMLEVPTDDAALLEKALLILQQFASDVTFDPSEVESERRVVLEEWRSRRSVQERVWDQQLPVLLAGSRYAERAPIGVKAVLEKAPVSALRRFYQDWYRPNLMAVVAVGDFDLPTMKATIEKVFAPLENPKDPRPHIEFPSPQGRGTRVSISRDKELSETWLTVAHTLPPRPQDTLADYQRGMLERLYHEMMNARLNDLARTPNPPFVKAYSGKKSFGRAADVFFEMALLPPRASASAFAAVTRELERIDRFGFVQAELDRARDHTLREYERLLDERRKTNSAGIADEIVRNFLARDAIPGIETELEIHREFLPTVKLAALNELPRAWMSDDNRVLLVSGSTRSSLPDEQRLLETISAVRAETLEPFVDRIAEGPLLPNPPVPGKILTETSVPEVNGTLWTLSNGVRVLFKPTTIHEDEVLVQGFSPGGHSLVGDADFPTAVYSASIVSEGGLGTLGPTELGKALAGKLVSVEPYIDEWEEGVSGRSSRKDQQTLFELVHLAMTAPRVDADAYAAWMAQQREHVANRRANPDAVFEDAGRALFYQRHPRHIPPTLQSLARVDMQRALRIYKQRFARADDFMFVVVGNTQAEALRPLLETYLASLAGANGADNVPPSSNESWRDVGTRIARGPQSLVVRRGIEPKASVVLVFTGNFQWSRESSFALDALEQALALRLREVVREKLTGTYNVFAWFKTFRRPRSAYALTINFACAPDRVDTLIQAVLDELEKVRQEGIAQDDVLKVRSALLSENHEDRSTNSRWLEELVDAYRHGDPLDHILDVKQLVENITAESVRDTARKVIDPKKVIKAVLLPENASKPVAKTSSKAN